MCFIYVYASLHDSVYASGFVWALFTGLIKSNRSLYVSINHNQGNKLTDLKFRGCIAHVINILLTELKTCAVSRIATLGVQTNKLFAEQIQVC